jgi:hypothetical protein
MVQICKKVQQKCAIFLEKKPKTIASIVFSNFICHFDCELGNFMRPIINQF